MLGVDFVSGLPHHGDRFAATAAMAEGRVESVGVHRSYRQLTAVLLVGLSALLSLAISISRISEGPPISSVTPARIPVFCYVETIFGGADANDLDFRPCTHVIEAFVLVDSSGDLHPANGLPRAAIITAAKKAGAKVLMAVGGATVPGTSFSAIARDPDRLQRFLVGLRDFVAQSGSDGVDLDWEFPSLAESPLYLRFVQAVRSALTTRPTPQNVPVPPIVTIPVAAYWIPAYDFAALRDEVDYVMLMGYDFRNPALGPWANDAAMWPLGATTPIEGSLRGAASEIIRRGLGHDKLVVAFPLYTSKNEPWLTVRERVLRSNARLHPLFLEKLIDDAWVTDPEALERKVSAALNGNQIAGGNAAGIALWQLGHQGQYRDLTDAVLRGLGRP